MHFKATIWVSVGLLSLVLPVGKAADSPWAAEVVSYNAGALAGSGFTNPSAALGSPERYTGENVFPGVVSPFNPPFLPSEIVGIGEGGHLTLHFDQLATDNPQHLYGVDLLVFGNAGFIDNAYPQGQTGNPAGLFGADGGVVEVSADGVNFFTVTGAVADGLFPTLGYLDSGPYDGQPGQIESDFTRPVDPNLNLSDWSGLTYAQIIARYDGAGGGAPIDLADAGLLAAAFIRISVPDDGNPQHDVEPVEIDAVSIVPEPSLGVLAMLAGGILLRRRRRA